MPSSFRHAASLAAVLLTIPAFAVTADARNFPVAGPFTSTLETGPGCTESQTVPPMCTHGLLASDHRHGLLAGARYEFSFDSQMPDPSTPGQTLYTGHSTIILAGGDVLYGHDHGALHPDADTGKLDFLTIVEIDGGSGPFEDARGRIAAGGAIDPATGAAVGHYTGNVEDQSCGDAR
jgi:hypothetical protein